MTIYKLKIIKKNILQKYKKAFTISVSSLKKTLLFRPIMINQFQFRIQIIIYKIKFHEDEFLLLLGQYGIKMNRFLTKFISPCASSLHYSDTKINLLLLDEVTNEKINFRPKINGEMLGKLKSITFGESFVIDSNKSQKIRILLLFLENQETNQS